MITIKQLMKSASVQLVFGLSFWLYAWLAHPNILGFLALGLLITLASNIYTVYKKSWNGYEFPLRLFKSCGLATLFMLVIYLMGIYLGGYGFIGFIIIIFAIAGWRIWNQWSFFKATIDEADDILHGRKREQP